jgi:hypothetical protein
MKGRRRHFWFLEWGEWTDPDDGLPFELFLVGGGYESRGRRRGRA